MMSSSLLSSSLPSSTTLTSPSLSIGRKSVVRPQPITETSLMETVGSFINEVQTYNSPQTVSADSKIQVTWARFEISDINDVTLYSEALDVNGNCPPLLLVLGYTSGVQVWLIPISGEAQEVLSWKQGQVKTLRLLPTPENVFGSPDHFVNVRPLVALSDSNGPPGTPFSSCSFISLKNGEQVHNIKFSSEIADIAVNRKVVLISFREKLAVFNACNLEARFTITSCFPSPGVDCNPIALGDRWLAYADQKMMPIHRSFGGMESDGTQSVTAWGINVGSKLAQGVSKIYSNIFASSPRSTASSSAPSACLSATSNEPQKGVVTILDIMQVSRPEQEETVNVADKIDGVIAHFVAHNKAIVALKFDASGSLLLTCDRLGNYFNLFRIVSHPSGSCYAAVHHLYSLYRGDTPGSVQDIAFSADSRWVAVSTLRGTTHIFPITPYGGPVGVRTHTSHRVVNRLSRFHRSAGIDGATTTSGRSSAGIGGRTSPNPTLGSSPGPGSILVDQSPSVVVPYPNPHMAPFPVPTLVQPVAQLKQPYLLSSLQHLGGSVSKKGGRSSIYDDIPIRLACTFAPSRAWLIGTQHNMFTRQQRNRNMDALYIMANHGVLLEYALDPVPESTLPKEKICESSPVELQIIPYGQWTLNKPRDKTELQPPLPIDNPLMLPLEQAGQNRERTTSFSGNDEEKWLSQVEIITHVGPHRRLWMGPQFSFKTLQLVGSDSDEVRITDVATRPQQSNPVNVKDRHPVPVLIEAGSASSSFELSPRFHNFHKHRRGSREQVHSDLETELHEAMSETIAPGDILDGPTKRLSKDEEFFCLTPDGSVGSNPTRSRNPSVTETSHKIPVSNNQNILNETKIFSVAVEARKSEPNLIDNLMVVDVASDFNGRFAVVSNVTKKNPSLEVAQDREVTPLFEEEKTEDLLDLSDESDRLLKEALSSEVSRDEEGPFNTIQRETVVNIKENGPKASSIRSEDEEDYEVDYFFPEKCAGDVDDEDDEENDVEEEEEEVKKASCPFGASTAKPEARHLPEDSIINDIERAEKKYESDSMFLDKYKSSSQDTTTSSISKWSLRWNRQTDSSEDDGEVFVPAVSRRQRKKKNNRYYDDSESTEDEKGEDKIEPEGWSFEADDLDVNRIISEVVSDVDKVSLDDVFKFDSEMQNEKSSSIEDGGMTSGGTSACGIGSTSESSSVGNSPNVKKTKGRNKKKKSRK